MHGHMNVKFQVLTAAFLKYQFFWYVNNVSNGEHLADVSEDRSALISGVKQRDILLGPRDP